MWITKYDFGKDKAPLMLFIDSLDNETTGAQVKIWLQHNSDDSNAQITTNEQFPKPILPKSFTPNSFDGANLLDIGTTLHRNF
jgi:hypothetical protein